MNYILRITSIPKEFYINLLKLSGNLDDMNILNPIHKYIYNIIWGKDFMIGEILETIWHIIFQEESVCHKTINKSIVDVKISIFKTIDPLG